MVFVHLAEGFEEIEAITIIDVLRRAGIEVVAVSTSGEYIVRGAHDIEIVSDVLFEEADYKNCNMIVLPGGMPGTTNLKAHKGLEIKIEDFFINKKYIAAICAAPMILGQMKILNKKRAVCYPGFEEYLQGAQIVDEDVVVDDNIITSKGPATAITFALKLVEILLSDEKKAQQIGKAMML